mmetsp:Transcript_16289/g.19421  ORF Transcript_16289/g.19421 Transcript_16289/m.19421 type:complete len:575 (-) Transcript_16289:1211-2935(-)
MAASPPRSPNSPARSLHSNYEARLRSPGQQFRPSPSRLRKSLLNSSIDGSTGTPTPKRDRAVYSDRFIPSRSGTKLENGFTLLEDSLSREDRMKASINSGSSPHEGGANGHTGTAGNTHSGSNPSNSSNNDGTNKEGFSTYSMLLRSELLGVDYDHNLAQSQQYMQQQSRQNSESRGEGDSREKNKNGTPTKIGSTSSVGSGGSPARNLFRFKAPRQTALDLKNSSFSLSPIGTASHGLLSSPRKIKRKIPKVPFKVLDAPALQDDFYLNLVDWSSLNVLAVGLGSCVYLWSACTSKVTKLCDLGSDDCVTSVCWTQRGNHLAVGTNKGEVQIWDSSKQKKIRTMGGHTARVGTMAWNAHQLASGSRDRHIYRRDVRVPEYYTGKLVGHKQEVCGLKWSFDDQQLASGGNDNKLFIWNVQSTLPVARFSDHTAAVKAIAWSPHQHGLLASGGGTADRCIRFWNTLTATPLNCIDTGSQVCNLMWSKNINEVVSTHGYSLNQIIVWKYPSMSKVTTLTGHTYRVLYLAMSPDGQTVVTGAGDETLRFWNVFPGPKNKDGSRLGTSLLFPSGADIR